MISIRFDQKEIDGTDRKPLSTLISIGIHTAFIAMLMLVPMVFTDVLPLAQIRDSILSAPGLPPAAPPHDARMVKIVSVERRVSAFKNGRLQAPMVIPAQVPTIVDSGPPPTPEAGLNEGVPFGLDDGSQRSLPWNAIAPKTQPPSPSVKPASGRPTRIRMVSTLSQANLIYAPSPIYPPLAKTARLQGTVVLEAIISKDGRISSLNVISGHPLLIRAAIDAVKQWRYRPTLLNGEPVEVETTITVNFRLRGD